MPAQVPSVRIVEVGPRDGLQTIPQIIGNHTKVNLIRRLWRCGLKNIEMTSFVSGYAVPQFADNKALVRDPRIQELLDKIHLPTVVHSKLSFSTALETHMNEVTVAVSASEGFSKANFNCSVWEGLEEAKGIIRMARMADIPVRGYIACIFSDPYDGKTAQSSVLRSVGALLDAGCYEVTLGDTMGVGTPSKVYALLRYLRDNGVGMSALACRFNDTYGMGVANVHEAFDFGIRVFDSSIAGIGGCPFAIGAKGNVATEDLVFLFEKEGIPTGINLAKLVDTATWLSQKLGRPSSSRAGTAITSLPKTLAPRLSWSLVREAPGMRVFRCEANLKIVLNRPKEGNFLTKQLMSSLTALFRDVRDDRTVSYIAVTGMGKYFSMGLAVPFGPENIDFSTQEQIDDEPCQMLGDLAEAMDAAPQVTLACLNGSAFGAGEVIALGCDICIAVADAEVVMNDERVSKYLAEEMNLSLETETMLRSELVTAQELSARGLVSMLADTAEEMPILIDRILLRLAQGPGPSLDDSRALNDRGQCPHSDAAADQLSSDTEKSFVKVCPLVEADSGTSESQAAPSPPDETVHELDGSPDQTEEVGHDNVLTAFRNVID